MREHACQSLVEFGSLIAAVGEEFFQERKHPKQGRHDENAAIAILNIGRMDDGMKQAQRNLREALSRRFGLRSRWRFNSPRSQLFNATILDCSKIKNHHE